MTCGPLIAISPGWPIGTYVRGRRVMWNDEIIGQAHGQPIRFVEAL